MALADAAGGLALMPLHPELSCTAPMQQCKHRLLPSSGVFLPVGCRVKAAESPVIGSSGIVQDTAGSLVLRHATDHRQVPQTSRFQDPGFHTGGNNFMNLRIAMSHVNMDKCSFHMTSC